MEATKPATVDMVATRNVNVRGKAYKAGDPIPGVPTREASFLESIGKANRSAIEDAKQNTARRTTTRRAKKDDDNDSGKDSGATSE